MPQSAPTLCHCGCVKQNGESCPRCKPKRDAEYNKTKRNKEATAFYQSSRWREVRQLVKQRDKGLCQICFKNNVIERGEHCDHIKPISVAPELAYTLENLRMLCIPCHNKVTREQEKEYGLK